MKFLMLSDIYSIYIYISFKKNIYLAKNKYFKTPIRFTKFYSKIILHGGGHISDRMCYAKL